MTCLSPIAPWFNRQGRPSNAEAYKSSAPRDVPGTAAKTTTITDTRQPHETFLFPAPAQALAAGSLALALTTAGIRAQSPEGSPKSAGEGKEGKLSTAEETYLQQTASDNLGEIAIAYLALEKAASNDTKTNAENIIDTHTKSMKQLMALASKHDFFVKLQPNLTSYDKLVDQGGNTFDKFYAAEQQKLNQEALDQLNGMMGQITSDDVKDFAKDDMKDDQTHLKDSKELASKLDKG